MNEIGAAINIYNKLNQDLDLLEKVKASLELARYDLSERDYLKEAKKAIQTTIGNESKTGDYVKIDSLGRLGSAYAAKGDFNEARALWEKAGELLGKTEGGFNKIKLYLNLAEAEADEGQFDQANEHWQQAHQTVLFIPNPTVRFDLGCQWYLSQYSYTNLNPREDAWHFIEDLQNKLAHSLVNQWFPYIVRGLKLAKISTNALTDLIEEAPIDNDEKVRLKEELNLPLLNKSQPGDIPFSEDNEIFDVRYDVRMHLKTARRLLSIDPVQALNHLDDIYNNDMLNVYLSAYEKAVNRNEVAELYYLVNQNNSVKNRSIQLWEEATNVALHEQNLPAARQIASTIAKHGLEKSNKICQELFNSLQKQADNKQSDLDSFLVEVLPAQAYHICQKKLDQIVENARDKSLFEDKLHSIKDYRKRGDALFGIAKVLFDNTHTSVENRQKAYTSILRMVQHWWVEAAYLEEAMQYFRVIQYLFAFETNTTRARKLLSVFDPKTALF